MQQLAVTRQSCVQWDFFLHCNLTSLLYFSKRPWLVRSMKNVNAGISSLWQNSCSEQLPDQRCQTEGEVFCQTETTRPVLELHRTLFLYVVDSLHPDSSPVYQSFPQNRGGSPMPPQREALSYVPDTTCHIGFCSVTVNRAQPLSLTFPNHVWYHFSRVCQRHTPKFAFTVCHLPPNCLFKATSNRKRNNALDYSLH